MKKNAFWICILALAFVLPGCAGINNDAKKEDSKKVFTASSANVLVNYDKYGNIQPMPNNKKGSAKVFTASAHNISVSYISDDYDYSFYNKGYLLPGDYNTKKEIITRDSITISGSTNIFLRNVTTGEEVLYITLPGIIKGYKYSTKNGNVYLIRQNNGKYELWGYDYQKKGEKLGESANQQFGHINLD